MTNPWLQLPKHPPFLLPDDGKLIQQVGSRLVDNYALHTNVLPEPFYGSRAASTVVLLALNPGMKGNEVELAAAHPEFAAENRKILSFESRYPFFHLDPAHDFHPGHAWWRPRLAGLIQRYGMEVVAKKLMVVQYFPYHSKAFRALPNTLPSQIFSFRLVEEAITKKKVIVLMRSRKLWLKAVPALRDYPFIELRFPRTPRIAPNHMAEGEYERVAAALE